MSGINPVQFAKALLPKLGAPVNHQTISALVGWATAEGGSVHNNPFNTTEDAPGATIFNSVGVKSYTNFNEALNATVKTLLDSSPQYGYGNIVGALRRSDPQGVGQAISSSSWGTGSLAESSIATALGHNWGVKPSGAPKQVAQQHAMGPGKPSTKTTSKTITEPGVTTKTTTGGGVDYVAALRSALLTPTAINVDGTLPAPSLLSKFQANVGSGAFTTPVVNNVSTSAGQSATITNKTIAQGKATGGKGQPNVGMPSKSGYINPLQGVTNWERTDQGVDANMPVGTPIKAPGDVKILGIEPGWYNGQPFVYFQFLNGPLKGKVQYVAEQIDNIAKVGSVIKEGGTIARYAPSGTGIEYGWATPSGQTLAMATSGYKEGYATAAGNNLRRWLNQHGANAGSGVGLSIGAGADPDDSAAALAQIDRAIRNVITQPGTKYHKPKYHAPAAD